MLTGVVASWLLEAPPGDPAAVRIFGGPEVAIPITERRGDGEDTVSLGPDEADWGGTLGLEWKGGLLGVSASASEWCRRGCSTSPQFSLVAFGGWEVGRLGVDLRLGAAIVPMRWSPVEWPQTTFPTRELGPEASLGLALQAAPGVYTTVRARHFQSLANYMPDIDGSLTWWPGTASVTSVALVLSVEIPPRWDAREPSG